MLDLGALARKAALSYGAPFVGGGVWAFAKFPDQLRWAESLYANAFGKLSFVYENITELPGYGEALDDALSEIRTIPRKVLDLATGTGYAATRLKRRFPSAEVVGTDITPEMIGIAQHQAVADDLDIRYEKADSSELPFGDGEFDLVVVHNSITFPEELMRVVAPGGRGLIVYSFGGPWVALAWSALAHQLESAGADYVWGRRSGPGFFGVARRSAIRGDV